MAAQVVPNRLKSIAKLGSYFDEFYDKSRQLRKEGPKEGQIVAWCDGNPVPFPLLVALDIPYVFGDAYAARAAAKHLEKRLQEVASDAGYMPEVCSYTRTAMGMAYMSDEEKDRSDPYYQMPSADFVLSTDPGCSMLVNWGKAISDYFQVPMFSLQVPHAWSYETDEKASVVELTRQFRELVTFLEDITHRKMNWDRLREIMQQVKEAAVFRYETLQLGRAKPAPATVFDYSAGLGGVNYLIGRPECVTYYRDVRDELADRVAQGIASVPNEKYRLYWDGIMIWPKLGHLARKFANYGAAVVANRYTHLGFFHDPDLLDPDKPLESMAASLTTMGPALGPDQLIDAISKLCVENSVDGIIMNALHTCRPMSGAQLEVMEAVSRDLGIPGVYFEADMADETYYSDAQLDMRVQALLETIDANRRRRQAG